MDDRWTSWTVHKWPKSGAQVHAISMRFLGFGGWWRRHRHEIRVLQRSSVMIMVCLLCRAPWCYSLVHIAQCKKKHTHKSAIFDLPNTSYSPVSKHVHDGDYAQSFSVYTTHSMRTVSYSVHNIHDQFNRFIRLHYFFFSLCHPKSFL